MGGWLSPPPHIEGVHPRPPMRSTRTCPATSYFAKSISKRVLTRSGFQRKFCQAEGETLLGQESRAEAVHQSLTGGVARVRGPSSLDYASPATSSSTFVVSGKAYEFHANHINYGREVASFYGIPLQDFFRFQSGQLAIGSLDTPVEADAGQVTFRVQQVIGIWEGRRFSVHVHLYDRTLADVGIACRVAS
jgi:hypothetical protein